MAAEKAPHVAPLELLPIERAGAPMGCAPAPAARTAAPGGCAGGAGAAARLLPAPRGSRQRMKEAVRTAVRV
eukprot:3775577-Prymnesium_polylepis.1